MRRRTHGPPLTAAFATTVAITTLAGCSGASSPAPPSSDSPPTTATALPQPQPDRAGSRVQVEGLVTWRTAHIGCAEMVTANGQRLRLVGQLATDRERAALGAGPRSERLRVAGFVPQRNKVGDTVCGSGIPFVLETIERN